MKKTKYLFFVAFATALTFGFTACSDDDDNPAEEQRNTADFESVVTGDNNVTSMVEGDNPITVNGFTFHGTQTTSDYGGYTYTSWSGFRASSSTSTTFNADYTDPNNYANSCVGHGYNNSAKFLVYFGGGNDFVDIPSTETSISGFYGAVNTYVQNSLLNGDSYAHKFDTGDWFRLDIIGVKDNNTTDTLSYYLADYRSSNASEHYYLSDWTWFDLSKLGKVKQIYFSFDSSDKSSYDGGKTYYLNTPMYVLIDNFNGVYDNKSARAKEATR